MPQSIGPIRPVDLPKPPEISPANLGEPGGPDKAGFKNVLLDSIHEVNAVQQQADQAVETLATGGDIEPAEVLTAVQKADLAFRMLMQVRNKIVAAYDEVRNIRV